MAEDDIKSDTITISELAKRLSLSETKTYELAAENELPFPVIRIGGRVMVSRDAYEEWLARYRYQTDDPPTDQD